MLAQVRPAGAADAAVVAGIQLHVWRQAFATVLPPELLGADPADLSAAWAARIAGGGPVLIATEGAEPVGFAAVGAEVTEIGDEGILPAPVGEIEVLYVLPRWARRGHGGRLLAESAARLRSVGADRGLWWVPAADEVTAAFLAGVGWYPDGPTRVLDTGTGTLVENRFGGGLEFHLG